MTTVQQTNEPSIKSSWHETSWKECVCALYQNPSKFHKTKLESRREIPILNDGFNVKIWLTNNGLATEERKSKGFQRCTFHSGGCIDN